MPDEDTLHRFVFEHSRVRGELVHLDHTWRSLLAREEYPDAVQTILGESLSAVALLAATVKFEGSLSLQIRGNGPLTLLLVQATGRRTLRGLARWNGDTSGASFNDMLGDEGLLSLTIDPGTGRERYQGIVETRGDSIAEVIQHYFEHSEQLPTRLWLASNPACTGGLLLQRLPGKDGDPDAWQRSVRLADTITSEELLSLSTHEVLRRLYHEEDVRVFRGRPMAFACNCSRERVQTMLRAMGREELQSVLSEAGVITVACEFCSAKYGFDAIDFELVFVDDEQPSVGTTRH